jgi:hypothetical protein
MVTEHQKQSSRDIFTLSKRLEDVLHDRFEIISTKAQKGRLDPAEIDAMVDETRDAIVMPVAQFVKRSSRR